MGSRVFFGFTAWFCFVGAIAQAENRETLRQEAAEFFGSLQHDGVALFRPHEINSRAQLISQRGDGAQYLKVLKKAYAYSVRPLLGNPPGLGSHPRDSVLFAEDAATRVDGEKYVSWHYGALRLALRPVLNQGPALSAEDALYFANEIADLPYPGRVLTNIDAFFKRGIKENFAGEKPLSTELAWEIANEAALTADPARSFERFQQAHRAGGTRLQPEVALAFARAAAHKAPSDRRFESPEIQTTLSLYEMATRSPQQGGLGAGSVLGQRFVDKAFATGKPAEWTAGFEKAYRYALNGYTRDGEVAAKPRKDGLNQTPEQARHFAEKHAASETLDADLARHWKLFNYARGGAAGNVLGLDETGALTFVEEALSSEIPERYLEEHRALYQFARRKLHMSGLEMSPEDALAFADARAGTLPKDEAPSEYLARYRAALAHAKLAVVSGGRGENEDQALRYADVAAGPKERSREYFLRLSEQVTEIRKSPHAQSYWSNGPEAYRLAEKLLSGPNWKSELANRRAVLERSFAETHLPDWQLGTDVALRFGNDPGAFDRFKEAYGYVASVQHQDRGTPHERVEAAYQIMEHPDVGAAGALYARNVRYNSQYGYGSRVIASVPPLPVMVPPVGPTCGGSAHDIVGRPTT